MKKNMSLHVLDKKVIYLLCIALAEYDLKNSTALIAHIDSTADTRLLAKIFKDISIDAKEYDRLVIGLIGGESPRRKVVEIVQYLESISVKC